MVAQSNPSLHDTFALDANHPARGPQEERVTCEHADRCGGCPLIALSYAEQLVEKRNHLAKSAMRYASLALVPTEAVAPAQPVVGYRIRAKLIAASGGRVGLFAKGGGHQIIDIPRCRVLAPSLGRVAAALRVRFIAAEREGGALAPFDGSVQGCVRAVDLREVVDGETTGVLATLVVQRQRVVTLEPLQLAARELMAAEPEVVGVACNFHDGVAPRVLGAQTVPLAGVTSAPDRVGASPHFATFGSFVQAHRGQASRIHALLATGFGLLGRGGVNEPRVLDLYGGSGSIALGLAQAGARVHLVESFAPAAAQARAAAAGFGLHLEVQCADVADALRGLAGRGTRFDAVVVNPPRRGTSPVAREWLARLAPRIIGYVSCDPETLARDLDHFARLGYGATALHPVDMMPLTDEVETVAFLKRTEMPVPSAVYEDREVVCVDKGPHEPCVPQGEYAGSLFARVRRMTGTESAVPLFRLDVGISGLVLFARRPEYVAKWQRVWSGASSRAMYVALVRGVTPAKGVLRRGTRGGPGTHPSGQMRYRRLAVIAGHSLVRIVDNGTLPSHIGRRLAAMGHPLVGDDRHGHVLTNRFFEEKNGLDRPFLHCARLEFEHPDSGAARVVESQLPGDLRMVLDRLRNLRHNSGAAPMD